MARQVLMRSSPVVIRRQPLFMVEEPKAAAARRGKKFGEVVGGTTAECAAVCCCCPCSVVELLVLGLVKVPTGLCRKAWRKHKRQRLCKKNLGYLGPVTFGPTREEWEAELDRIVGKGDDEDDGSTGAVDLDQEMWDRFYGAGFWRSPSQRAS